MKKKVLSLIYDKIRILTWINSQHLTNQWVDTLMKLVPREERGSKSIKGLKPKIRLLIRAPHITKCLECNEIESHFDIWVV